jgi:hypothetical protein
MITIKKSTIDAILESIGLESIVPDKVPNASLIKIQE